MDRVNRECGKLYSEGLSDLKRLVVTWEWEKLHSEELSDLKWLEVTGNWEKYIVRKLVT
jgi:hypothetical protein